MGQLIVVNQTAEAETPATPLSEGVTKSCRISPMRSLVTSQFEPIYHELARQGRIYIAGAGVLANAQATVADTPTTAAAYVLYNKAATSSKTCLVPLFVSGQQMSGTPAVNTALMISTPGAVASAPTANGTGQTVSSSSGSSRASNAWYSTGATFSVAQSWFTVAGNNQTATAGVGSGLFAPVSGVVIVRPGQAFGATVLSAVGTNHKWGINIIFGEIDSDNL